MNTNDQSLIDSDDYDSIRNSHVDIEPFNAERYDLSFGENSQYARNKERHLILKRLSSVYDSACCRLVGFESPLING